MELNQRYDYKPLERGSQIRLLDLFPGDKSAPIKISLFHVDLSKQPQYEALSYTWGPPKDTISISCDSDGVALSVTRNCEAALRRLRSLVKPRTLWIDAICIDQSNTDEKSHQLTLMSDIYTLAETVFAYLGEASDESNIGMDFILQDSRAFSQMNGHRPSVGLGPGSTSSPQQVAIDQILSRPYFSRIWVIQEIVFARAVQIILGDKAVEWDAFSRTVFYVNHNKQYHLGQRKNLPRILSYKERTTSLLTGNVSSGKPDSLLQLLGDTRSCKATDGRDKVFALLDMSVEKYEKDLLPDYRVGIRETFINLVKFFIRKDMKLDVLCHVQSTRSKHDLPSWAPDWTFPYTCHILGHEKNLSTRPYKASQGRNANVIFKADLKTLVVEGKVFDRVLKVGAVYDTDGDLPFNKLRQWENMVSISDVNNTNAPFTDTLIAYPPYNRPNVFMRFHSSWHRYIFGDQQLSMNEKSEAMIFQEQVAKACHGRCFFITEKGHMGLGPAEISEGDSVTILLGGSVPFILRQQGTQYTLLGESYVHGAMNGEVTEDPTVGFEMISII